MKTHLLVSVVEAHIFKEMNASDCNSESMACTKLQAKPSKPGNSPNTHLDHQIRSYLGTGSNPIPSAPDVARCLRRNLSPCLTGAAEDAVQGAAGALALSSEGIGCRAIRRHRAASHQVGPGRDRAFLKEDDHTSLTRHVNMPCVYFSMTLAASKRFWRARGWAEVPTCRAPMGPRNPDTQAVVSGHLA